MSHTPDDEQATSTLRRVMDVILEEHPRWLEAKTTAKLFAIRYRAGELKKDDVLSYLRSLEHTFGGFTDG